MLYNCINYCKKEKMFIALVVNQITLRIVNSVFIMNSVYEYAQ